MISHFACTEVNVIRLYIWLTLKNSCKVASHNHHQQLETDCTVCTPQVLTSSSTRPSQDRSEIQKRQPSTNSDLQLNTQEPV